MNTMSSSSRVVDDRKQTRRQTRSRRSTRFAPDVDNLLVSGAAARKYPLQFIDADAQK